MVHTFTGANTFELHHELNKRTKKVLDEAGEFALQRVDASELAYDELVQAVESLPFLAPQKLVVVRDAHLNSELLEKIEVFIGRVAEQVEVILVGSFDRRKSSYKALQKLTEVKVFSEKKPFELPKWVSDYAKDKGLEIDSDAARYLLARIGSDQLLLSKEIEKLGIYNRKITRATIDLLTDETPQQTIFQLLDAAFGKKPKQAIEYYRQLRAAKLDPHYIIAMVIWQLYGLARAVHANPQTEKTLIATGMSPFTAEKMLDLAQNVSKKELCMAVEGITDLDAQIKSGADADAGLELYLITLMK